MNESQARARFEEIAACRGLRLDREGDIYLSHETGVAWSFYLDGLFDQPNQQKQRCPHCQSGMPRMGAVHYDELGVVRCQRLAPEPKKA